MSDRVKKKGTGSSSHDPRAEKVTAAQMVQAKANPAQQRVMQLLAHDEQFRNACPLESVAQAKHQPGLRLAEVVRTVMEGYADRPAVGRRSREPVNDPATGRRLMRLLPRFENTSYHELWDRARAVAGEWHHHGQYPLKPGDFVNILGFTGSPDYVTLVLSSIHLGAVQTPLQTSMPKAQLAAIIAETEPRIFAAGIEYIDAVIDAVLIGTQPQRLLVFDYDAHDDEQRERLDAARKRLAAAGSAIAVDTLDEIAERGKSLPATPLFAPEADKDPLASVFYTSGTTGTPKGAILTESQAIDHWLGDMKLPLIILSFMPMSHLGGYGLLMRTLGNGGVGYSSPKSDLSTLFEDLALVRPTVGVFVPRVCEIFYRHYLSEVDRRVAQGGDTATVEAEAKRTMREEMLGGRMLGPNGGTASMAPETYAFMEDMLGLHMVIGYGATEFGGPPVLVDWKVQRPPVIDYKLVDVPELGYFNTDKPFPRGELLVKTSRLTTGYYKQPELTAEKIDKDGYYATGDVMVEMGPDHLVFINRRNDVMKLSQGEFVAVAKLETLYAHSPDIRQVYIYGTGERAFLIAVIVPSKELTDRIGAGGEGTGEVKAKLRAALRQIAVEEQLLGYEIPRDFLIEPEPFSNANGLLSDVGKNLRPKLKDRYGERLEALYARLAKEQLDELRALRLAGRDRPALETISRALQSTLGISQADMRPDVPFKHLGGDSLSALAFSTLLEEIFGVEVPVGVIIGPAGNARQLAEYVEAERNTGAKRPTFATVHDARIDQVHAADLTLEKFIDPEVLAKAPTLPAPDGDTRTVLLTGATGFLGRFQALAWLERMAETGGKVICIVRGNDAAQARQRIEDTLDTDPELMAYFRTLAADRLEVLAGDLSQPNLGLDHDNWNRLAETVDLIVHVAAHVNHMLPYNQLFSANVVGTAEIIRLAVTTRLKQVHYVSTVAVELFADKMTDEDSDVREAIPVCERNDGYANGYVISKWAGEVLMREAHDRCRLPVAVFRPNMILAHRRYAGQVNVPDMFTRLLFSLAVTGVAPATFYAQDLSNGRPAAHYDGLPVDFLANAVTAIGARHTDGFQSYNLSRQFGDNVSLDDIVDWMIAAGCGIKRIDRYNDWLSRFETAMQALPEDRKQESILTIIGPYRTPQPAVEQRPVRTERFRSACEASGCALPSLTEALITKYVADLRHLRLL